MILLVEEEKKGEQSMHFCKGVIVRIALISCLALSGIFGSVVEATGTPPPPGTPIVVRTYGVLPVMVINLTQSALNYYVTPGSPAVYSGSGAPVAIGLHGWAFINNGVNSSSTPYFNNPTTPNTPPSGANNPSLSPVASVSSGANPVFSAATVNPNWSFMNAFTLFPSWRALSLFPILNISFLPTREPLAWAQHRDLRSTYVPASALSYGDGNGNNYGWATQATGTTEVSSPQSDNTFNVSQFLTIQGTGTTANNWFPVPTTNGGLYTPSNLNSAALGYPNFSSTSGVTAVVGQDYDLIVYLQSGDYADLSLIFVAVPHSAVTAVRK